MLTSLSLDPGSSRARARGLKAVAVTVLVALALLPAVVLAQAAATVQAGGNAELGDFLVGDNGFTLYIFTVDEPGVSNCSGMCEQLWPPLTVDAGVTPTAGDGVPGSLGVTERDDGTRQVTYNDRPLYFFSNDSEPGDTNGQGFVDRWFVAAVSGEQQTTPTPAAPTAPVGGSAELGDFLVGDNGFTLYIFTVDEPGVSNCSGMCEQLWPPLTVDAGVTPTAGDGVPGSLGVTERDDGTRQVTYNDRPLYFFSNDSEPGDTNGQGFVDRWFVAAVSGEQQTTPTPAPPSAGNFGLASEGDSAAAFPALLLLAAAGLLAAGGRALTGGRRAS